MKTDKFLSEIDFKNPPKLTFLKRLTNQTGIIQHTKYAVPDRNLGYSVDDNARALIVSILFYKLFQDEAALELAVTYLSYTQHSKSKDNWFYNFLTFDNQFLNQAKTEDGFGRCFWALGYTIYAAPRRDLLMGAKHTIDTIKENIPKLISPRAKAYTIAGVYYLLEVHKDESGLKQDLVNLADSLVSQYKKYSKPGWDWFENYLTYCNGIFPYSLALAYQATGNKQYLVIAKECLEFLEKETNTAEGVPCPIGQDGWFIRGEKKALFDQQPVEAANMVLANLAIFKITFEEKYYLSARSWFSWYHGNNVKKVLVYDSVTTGCFDGINPEGVNLNQGAESIVTYLIAYLAFSDIELKLNP